MFTGLVDHVGQITGIKRSTDIWQLTIDAGPLATKLCHGDSLAVDGICLTITDSTKTKVTVQASTQTKTATTLASWHRGRKVNLEPALQASDRLDGHIVTGHIDGIGRIRKLHKTKATVVLTIMPPADILPLLASRGSVAVDGVSLTIAELLGSSFTTHIIPETLTRTTIGLYRPQTMVNVEADILARYAYRALQHIHGGKHSD